MECATYDAAGRLTAVADASGGTTIATFAYDAFNRRISATEGGATVFFHYDGASARVIAETDGSGATLASYTYDAAGNLFSMSRGGETYFYHTNARGDVVAMSDSQGDVVNTYTYDPWGAPLTASETVENPYRYASYRYDTSTGLYYCWNRYYAPELARFLTRDIYPGELADPVTMNPYLYCGGDPVNYVDPSGKLLNPLSVGIICAVIAGVAIVGMVLCGLQPVKKQADEDRALIQQLYESGELTDEEIIAYLERHRDREEVAAMIAYIQANGASAMLATGGGADASAALLEILIMEIGMGKAGVDSEPR